MSSDISTTGSSGDSSLTEPVPPMVDRLLALTRQTNLLALDATLTAQPRLGFCGVMAAQEVRGVAQRMLRTTRDFTAATAELG